MSNDQSTGSGVQQQGLLQLRSTTPRESETNFGLEYIHARREVQSGESGTLNRLQAAAQYFF